MRSLHVVVDLQFGSTGKGLLAGYLGKKISPDTLITAWGPNSGHTYVDEFGEKFVNIMLPNAIQTSNRLRRVLIGPGSIINPEIMLDEVRRYWPKLASCQLLIHPHAAVVTEEHRHLEAQYGFGIGSTMKGVGEAVIQKMRRRTGEGVFPNIAREALARTELADFVTTAEIYNRAVDDADVVLLEGAQGFSLGINSGFYPYCTSRECTTAQLISDCGLPFGGSSLNVYGVARTYPIRVANRYKDGVMVGTSGPGYDDQRELNWSDIGREPELTTVTKLPRRIFTFSEEQIAAAVRMNGVDCVFLNFCNYDWPPDTPADHEVNDAKLRDKIDAIEKYAPVRWLGWGPKVTDVKENLR